MAGVLAAITIWLSTSLFVFASDAPVMQVETSRPNINIFEIGEPVFLHVELSQGVNQTEYLADFKVEDEKGRMTQEIQGVKLFLGSARSLQLRADKLGFYRVYGRLKGVNMISSLGSRPEGYITLAVVPKVSQRLLLSPERSFFGLQGGYAAKIPVLPYLGVRWVLGGKGWNSVDSDRGQGRSMEASKLTGPDALALPISEEQIPGAESWEVFTLPTLFTPPAWAIKGNKVAPLSSSEEFAWSAYCRAEAQYNLRKYPNQTKRLYQITWEPDFPGNFPGNSAQLVKLYQLCYPEIHATDEHAVVLGPTSGIYAGDINASLVWNRSILQAGLWRYIDAFSVHPYFSTNVQQGYSPVKGRLAEFYIELRQMIAKYSGKNMPIYGTEQGLASNGTPLSELRQAQGLIQANLIALGEGLRMNMLFYLSDYKKEPGFGLFYNLDNNLQFGPSHVSPKPIAAAFAAQTFLLEGYGPVGNKFHNGSIDGYSYYSDHDEIHALWSSAGLKRVTFSTSASDYHIYDWMGNMSENNEVVGNTLTEVIGEDPKYIRMARGAALRILSVEPAP